jgi:thiamine pyrophosphate-dependent acetolactate synthase large subunit-like protein
LHSNKVPIHPLRLCNEVKDVISRDTILVVDGHEILNFARQSIPIYESGSSLNAGPHGCMGVGIPFGIGAQVAAPDKPVVVLSGDGAFGWNGMEMDTAIRHKLPIVVVLSNNGGFTSRQTGGTVGRDLGFQRYDKMVEALGGYGEYVEQPKDIKPAIERAIKEWSDCTGQRMHRPGCASDYRHGICGILRFQWRSLMLNLSRMAKMLLPAQLVCMTS